MYVCKLWLQLSNDVYNLRACSVMLRVLRTALAMSGMLEYIVRSG
jgi:hypothetical protein